MFTLGFAVHIFMIILTLFFLLSYKSFYLLVSLPTHVHNCIIFLSNSALGFSSSATRGGFVQGLLLKLPMWPCALCQFLLPELVSKWSWCLLCPFHFMFTMSVLFVIQVEQYFHSCTDYTCWYSCCCISSFKVLDLTTLTVDWNLT